MSPRAAKNARALDSVARVYLFLDLVGFVLRFLAGRPLDGVARTDSTWLRPARMPVTPDGTPNPGARVSTWAMWPGWKRTLVRLGVLPAVIVVLVAYFRAPRLVIAIMVVTGACLIARMAYRVRRDWRVRRHNDTYVRPLATVVANLVTLQGDPRPDQWLTVSPDLGGLAARLIEPMSPAELAWRAWYGAHLQPVVQWTPEHLWRAGQWIAERTAPARALVSRPTEDDDRPRIEMRLPVPYVAPEVRLAVRQAVSDKLGLNRSDLREHWDLVGWVTTATWTMVERAPQKVGLADIAEYIDTLDEWEFVLGLSASKAVVVSLDDDSPHIACSAGSGAGKSVLAMLIAIQVLRRGGHVTILDGKGSHRWAVGLPGVTYCRKPKEMHEELIRLEALAESRNDEAMEHEEGWDCGPREFVIFEEMNATVGKLKTFWENIKEKGDPKTSPAIQAFRNLMYMGRSAKVNLFGVAQMLTANTTGGPEARENFGIRALARYTANNWKMLAPEAKMPPKSTIRGRWQIVVAGEATECQVAFLHPHEARALALGEELVLAGVPAPLRGVPASQASAVPESGQGRPSPVPGQRSAFPPRRYPESYRHAPAQTQTGSPEGIDTSTTVPTAENGSQAANEPVSPADPFREPITLADAIQMGILTGSYDAVRKRVQRARPGSRPTPLGKRGNADLYRPADLIEFAERTGADA